MAEAAGVDVELFIRSLLGGFFQGDTVRQLVQQSREVFFAESERLFREGQASQFIYFIIDGTVALEREGSDAWTFGPGDVVGVLDADVGAAHHRTATAYSDVHAFALQLRDWEDIQEDDFDLVRLRLIANARNLLHTGLRLAPSCGFDGTGAAQPPREASQLSVEPELNAFGRLLALRVTPAFRLAGTQALLELAHEAKELRATAGETLFEEGDEASAIYLVVAGDVGFERREPEVRARFASTQLVGGYMGFGQECQPATARAVTEVVVVVIQLEHLFEVMEDHFDLARAMLSFMALERIRVQEQAPPVAAIYEIAGGAARRERRGA